jgi:hypothetical protein
MGGIIKDSIAQWALGIYRRTPTYGKAVIIVLIILVLFSLSRNGLFGSQLQALSERIIPVRISWIDPPRSMIQLELFIDVKTDKINEWQPVVLDGSYPSESNMMLSYSARPSCWLLILGVDSKKVYPIVYEDQGHGNFSAIYYTPAPSPSQLPFRLDGTVGREAYIAIASYDRFDYQNHVTSALTQALKTESTRGPEMKFKLELDKDFYQRAVYFNTLKMH